MPVKARFLLGISVFWLPLSVLFDGLNTLVMPVLIAGVVAGSRQASVLGVLTFLGLLVGMLVQPLAGTLSDHWRARIGRKGFLWIGVLAILLSLAFLGFSSSLFLLAAGYILVQLSASIAQASQQALIPDLVPASDRGKASGWKAFMDIGGAMLGFVLLGQFLGQGRAGLALAVMGILLVVAMFLVAVMVREKPAHEDPLPAEVRPKPGSLLSRAFHWDWKRERSFTWVVVSRFFFLSGTYAVGRFLLFFIAERLSLSPEEAAQQAGYVLASLAFATVLFAPVAGWAADRWGRISVILFGSLVSATGVLLLIVAASLGQILAFGVLMSIGSAAFASANWALTADLVPPAESARYFGLANIGTAGAAAAAGLLGPLVDWVNAANPGAGYPLLFVISAAAFGLSAVVLRWLKQASPGRRKEPVRAMDQHELK